MRNSPLRPAALVAAALLVALAAIQPAAAVDPHGPARNSASIKLGAFLPEGDSDRWEFNDEVLGSDEDDFLDAALGLEFNRQLNNYLAVSADVMIYEGDDRSRFRLDLVNFRQQTELTLLPVMANVLWQPGGKYRSGGTGYPGRLRAAVPYLGAGVGAVFWEHEIRVQEYYPPHGHYHRVNRERSDGVAPAAMVLLGVEIPLWGPAALVVEGRYLWADDDVDNDTFNLEDDFLDVEDLDLGGASLLIGGSFRF